MRQEAKSSFKYLVTVKHCFQHRCQVGGGGECRWWIKPIPTKGGISRVRSFKNILTSICPITDNFDAHPCECSPLQAASPTQAVNYRHMVEWLANLCQTVKPIWISHHKKSLKLLLNSLTVYWWMFCFKRFFWKYRKLQVCCSLLFSWLAATKALMQPIQSVYDITISNYCLYIGEDKICVRLSFIWNENIWKFVDF